MYNFIMIGFGWLTRNPKLFWVSFLLPFIYRVLSGIQNGFGYAKNFPATFFFTLLMIFVAFYSLRFFRHKKEWHFYLAFFTSFLVSFSAFLVHYSFVRPEQWISDIHLWETITTGLFTLFWIVEGSPLAVLLSIYPALILHKIAINLGSGLPPLASQKYFDLLGWKIPSGGSILRLILAGISVSLLLIINKIK